MVTGWGYPQAFGVTGGGVRGWLTPRKHFAFDQPHHNKILGKSIFWIHETRFQKLSKLHLHSQ